MSSGPTLRPVFIFALIVLLPVAAGAADFQLRAAATWADNLSRTSFAPTQKDAALYTVGGSASHIRQLAPNWTASAGVDLEAETVPDFDALNRLGAGVRGALRRKFGLGPLAPVADLGVALHHGRYREDGRSGWHQEASLTFAKRLTETFRLSATGSWTRYDAEHAPYDVQHRRLAVEAVWDATERWRLRAGAARLDGQLTANATGDVYAQALAGAFGEPIRAYYSSVPFATTGSFGPGWVAYRVESEADFLWGEISFAAADRTALTLRHETVKVVNVVGVRYDSAFWSLSLVHQF